MEIYPNRRIFINRKGRHYQIFSFKQHNDGSIYCSSPDFADSKWITYEISSNGPQLKTTKSIGEGKISVHGTGFTAIRANDRPTEHELIIQGNNLLDREKNTAGARHLFTAFLKEPSYLPEGSPVFNRQSDYALQANEELKPFVLAFFAVPHQQQKITTHFEFNLHESETNNVPNDFLGLHFFSLRYHDVMWFAYRTKNMDKWPKYSHFSYHDGYTFPIFIGTGAETFRLEFRMPTYSLEGQDFTIRCITPYDSVD